MKFTIAAVLSTLAGSAVAMKGPKAAELVSQARRLNDQEVDYSWVNDFSIKYQGCHHIVQWNQEANGQDDVRIYTKRLVRFRLCPADTCSADLAGGCQSGYGDYIVDMDTYLEMYWNAKEEDDEISCQWLLNDVCECDENDDQDYCLWDCAAAYGREDCIEGGNPNNENGEEQEEQINYQEFMECKQIEANNNQNQNNQNNNGEEVAYYSGPYCSEQGGAIKIGVFTDDQCTEFAEGVSLYDLTGVYNMYTEESIVSETCVTCAQPEEWQEDDGNNNNNNNQNEEAQEPREVCTNLYDSAGKCETYMGSTLGEAYINEQACNYLGGIKMVRNDGLLDVSDARPSAVATAFIVIFAMAFAAMAFYVWYLRTRLGVKKNSLL